MSAGFCAANNLSLNSGRGSGSLESLFSPSPWTTGQNTPLPIEQGWRLNKPGRSERGRKGRPGLQNPQPRAVILATGWSPTLLALGAALGFGYRTGVGPRRGFESKMSRATHPLTFRALTFRILTFRALTFRAQFDGGRPTRGEVLQLHYNKRRAAEEVEADLESRQTLRSVVWRDSEERDKIR